MTVQSNIPLPTTPQKWKDNQFAYYYNHVDNGVQTEENEGRRYTADHTILDDYTASAVINALTRKQYDAVLEHAVVDNIEVDGKEAITVKIDYPTKVSTAIFPSLPATGNVKRGVIYSYGNGAVMVVQDHARTAFAPELTPALFSFYREVTEGKEWILGEVITLNATRTYNGKTYKCIQSHQSQATWNPELTLGTLWQVVATSSAWIIGVAYKVNDMVTYLTKSYKCLQGHTSIQTWNPVAAASLWKLQ